MRRVEQIMGMPISIDIVDCDDESIFKKAFERLRLIDERFSTYKSDSEVMRYRRGGIKPEKLSAEFKKVVKACYEAEQMTEGYFSAWYGRQFDPSGYVKGWAVAEAGKVI